MHRFMRLYTIFLVLAVLPHTLAPANMVKKKKTNPDYVQILPGNNQFLAVDKKNGTIFILGLPDMEVRREFKGDKGRSVVDYAISPDNKWLLATFKKGSLWVWDLASGEVKFKTPVKASAYKFPKYQFLPDGDRLILQDDAAKQITIWDIQGGAIIGTPITSETPNYGDLVLAPSGKFLVVIASTGYTTSQTCVRVYSLPDGQLLKEMELMDMMFDRTQVSAGIGFVVQSLEFDSDDKISMNVKIPMSTSSEDYTVTASIPDLGNAEKSRIDSEIKKRDTELFGWYTGPRMLNSNQKAMLTEQFGALLPGIKVVQLDENNEPGDDLWHIIKSKAIPRFTSWDVSTDGALVVIGCAKTRSLYLYDASKLIKKDYTFAGVTTEWQEPTLVKTISMP